MINLSASNHHYYLEQELDFLNLTFSMVIKSFCNDVKILNTKTMLMELSF